VVRVPVEPRNLSLFNHLTPNDHYSGRTAPLNSKRCILYIYSTNIGRVKTECGGTRAETRFGLSAKWTSPFLSAGVSVQSAAGSRSMRISGSNAG